MCFPSSEPFHYGQRYSGTGQDPNQDVSADETLQGNSFDGMFEMMVNHTDYYLRAANILLMEKWLQLTFTETMCYLQFVKNTIDTDSAQKLMQRDLKKLDPETEHN